MEFVKIMILLLVVIMPFIHSLSTQKTISEIQDAEDNTKYRQKRCGHSGSSDTTSTTARNRNWEFEHPPKEGDPVDPIDKENRLLPQKRYIKIEPSRGQALFKEVLSSLINIVRPKRNVKNERDRADSNEESTKQRKKRGLDDWFGWLKPATTTTERFRDLWFENPIKPGDPMEPFVWTNKLFGTTPRPGSLIFRESRSADEDNTKSKSNDEDAASLQ